MIDLKPIINIAVIAAVVITIASVAYKRYVEIKLAKKKLKEKGEVKK